MCWRHCCLNLLFRKIIFNRKITWKINLRESINFFKFFLVIFTKLLKKIKLKNMQLFYYFWKFCCHYWTCNNINIFSSCNSYCFCLINQYMHIQILKNYLIRQEWNQESKCTNIPFLLCWNFILFKFDPVLNLEDKHLICINILSQRIRRIILLLENDKPVLTTLFHSS